MCVRHWNRKGGNVCGTACTTGHCVIGCASCCGGGECFGYWDVGTRTIYVDKTVGERKQRYVLTHELMHAVADWQHVYLGEDTE